MTRKAAIGIGGKYDFSKDTRGFPPPNRYNIEDFVKSNVVKKKGCSLGLGRKDVKVNSW